MKITVKSNGNDKQARLLLRTATWHKNSFEPSATDGVV